MYTIIQINTVLFGIFKQEKKDERTTGPVSKGKGIS